MNQFQSPDHGYRWVFSWGDQQNTWLVSTIECHRPRRRNLTTRHIQSAKWKTVERCFGEAEKVTQIYSSIFCENLTETEKGEMGADNDSLAPDTKEMLTTVFRCNKKLILMRYSSWCNHGLAAFTLTLVSTPQEVRCSWQRFSLWCRAGQPHEICWYYNF